MLRKCSLYLPLDLYEDLQALSREHRTSLTDVIRGKILQTKVDSENRHSSSQILSLLQSIHQKLLEQKETSSSQTPSSMNQNSDFLLVEILFLLREFLFERNGQVLRKVDEKLDQHFGKDRRKVL